jgi:hypothetical protein
MEMDPNSAAFQRIFSNVFAYTAFKSTEPWLVDYVTLDLHDAMKQVRPLLTSALARAVASVVAADAIECLASRMSGAAKC